MKHIKKKFRFEKILLEEEWSKFKEQHDNVNIEEAKSSNKYSYIFDNGCSPK